MLGNDTEKLDGLRTYIDGKMKRYTLLFAVNGGAFAIAQVKPELLGLLKLSYVAVGAIVFTGAMMVDIWAWGERMKRDFFNGSSMVFSVAGKIIVGLLSLLLILAWSLAAPLKWEWILGLVGLIAAATLGTHWQISKESRT